MASLEHLAYFFIKFSDIIEYSRLGTGQGFIHNPTLIYMLGNSLFCRGHMATDLTIAGTWIEIMDILSGRDVAPVPPTVSIKQYHAAYKRLGARWQIDTLRNAFNKSHFPYTTRTSSKLGETHVLSSSDRREFSLVYCLMKVDMGTRSQTRFSD